MRFDGGRLHQTFDLNGSASRGPTHVMRAARDPVQVPTEPAIVEALKKNLCTCRVMDGGYRITNPLGDFRMVRYGAPLSDWTKACEELLARAMETDRVI